MENLILMVLKVIPNNFEILQNHKTQPNVTESSTELTSLILMAI